MTADTIAISTGSRAEVDPITLEILFNALRSVPRLLHVVSVQKD